MRTDGRAPTWTISPSYTCPRCLSREERAEAVERDEADRDPINTATDTTRETE